MFPCAAVPGTEARVCVCFSIKNSLGPSSKGGGVQNFFNTEAILRAESTAFILRQYRAPMQLSATHRVGAAKRRNITSLGRQP